MATIFYPQLNATTSNNIVNGTVSDDLIIISGDVFAEGNWYNRIYGNGGNDNLVINGSLSSNNVTAPIPWDQRTEIAFTDGNSVAFVGGDVLSDAGFVNIDFQSNSAELIVQGALSSLDDGSIHINADTTDNNFQFGEITSNQEGQVMITARGASEITIDNSVSSYGDGIMGALNEIRLTGEGDKNVFIGGDLRGQGAGNTIQIENTPDFDNTLTIAGNVIAESYNSSIFLTGGRAYFTVGGDMIAKDNGMNYINIYGNEYQSFLLEGELRAEGGSNHINYQLSSSDSSGASNFEVLNGLTAVDGGNTIQAYTSSGTQFLDFHANDQTGLALFAGAGGHNNIVGSGSIAVEGGISIAEDGHNSITFWDTATLSLNGQVTESALDISMAGEYDTLLLNAPSYLSFSNYYQDWLSDLDTNDAINDMGLEAIRVDLGRPSDSAINSIAWLDDIVSTHNTAYDEQIALELNIDKAGVNLDLDDFFSDSRSDMFSGLDMTGRTSNTLEITDTLADSGMSGNFLRLLGDTQDTVSLTDNWTQSQANFVDETGLTYNVYTNNTDELLIQSTISVV